MMVVMPVVVMVMIVTTSAAVVMAMMMVAVVVIMRRGGAGLRVDAHGAWNLKSVLVRVYSKIANLPRGVLVAPSGMLQSRMLCRNRSS
jgi:hypothetical protein